MDIISLDFLMLCAVTGVICFVVPKNYRWTVLLASSIYFYSFVGKRALLTLISISIFVFFAAKSMQKSEVEGKKRKLLLTIAVVFVVGWLSIIKIKDAFGFHLSFLITPLGISYLTFSLIGYLVDIYWEKDTADDNLLKFLLYVFYFPKISQGPISKHSNLADKLYTGGELSYTNVCFGCQRMIYGYFKKLVIADRIALFTDQVFDDILLHSGSTVILAMILASVQLYCDFSGYMDIVLGVSEILGIKMEENFNHPFFSTSSAEFWRRWHITLGAWFKDYVYTPIVMSHTVKNLGKWGRKKFSKQFGNALMKIIALSAVWVLTGLWHGTGINYVIWGVYWGTIIIISTVFEKNILKVTKALHINTGTQIWKLFQRIRTFAIFCGGILMTRVNTVSELKAAVYNVIYHINLRALFDGTLQTLGWMKADILIVSVSLILLWGIEIVEERKGDVRQQIARLSAPVRWLTYSLFLTLVLLVGIYGSEYNTSGFAYTHF